MAKIKPIYKRIFDSYHPLIYKARSTRLRADHHRVRPKSLLDLEALVGLGSSHLEMRVVHFFACGVSEADTVKALLEKHEKLRLDHSVTIDPPIGGLSLWLLVSDNLLLVKTDGQAGY